MALMIHALPEKGFLKRMRVYFHEMFPLLPRLTSSILLYVSFTLLLQSIHQTTIQMFTFFTLTGIWSVFSITLTLRLMDELKDKDVDLRLFSTRPLPSGKVLERDIIFCLTITVLSFLIANSWTGYVFLASLIVLGYTFLMFKFFFIPNIMRKNLFLSLLTHNPVVAVLLLYLSLLFGADNGFSPCSLQWSSILPLVAMFWLPLTAWEISRKIRSPEEENEYVTYSRILGRHAAVFLSGSLITFSFILCVLLFIRLSYSWICFTSLSAGYCIALYAFIRFLLSPKPDTSKLRPYTELFIIGMFISPIIEFSFNLL